MKITNTVKKFQFFDEKKNIEQNETFLKHKLSLKDIDPIQMEIQNKILFISGKIPERKNQDSESKSSLFKIYNGTIIEDYKLFNKQICRFKFVYYKDQCYLCAIGYDLQSDIKKGDTPIPLLKIYDFSECVNTNSIKGKSLLKEISLTEGNVISNSKEEGNSNKMTCFDITNNLTNAAIGFRNGRVLLISSRYSLHNSSSQVFKYLSGEIEEENKAITNIAYGTVDNKMILFITSLTQIYFYKVDETQEVGYTIPEPGILPNCFSLCEGKNYFTVVTEGKIAFYVNLDQGPSWFFEGKKKCCYCFKDYIIFVSTEDKVSTLQIFDPNSKFFALYQNSFDQILNITTDDEDIYVLYENESENDKYIKVLHEKENKEKFDTFYKKSFYDSAYEYARNLNYDQRMLSDISERYAKFLYAKGDYKKSIEQYIKTINYLQPIYVIQPFVEGSKLEYLIEYLEAIHKDKDMKKNCPPDEMKDYSALLLNCYIKKKQLNKLKQFIEEKNDEEQIIDINTVIEVCKESDLALSIAEKSQFIEPSIQILIDIKQDYKEALKTLNKEKDINKKFKLILKYGEKLIEKYPKETIDYIQVFLKEIIDLKNSEDEKKKNEISNIQYDPLIQILIKHQSKLEEILDFIITNDYNCPVSVIHRRIEIYTEQKNTKKIKEFLQNKNYSEKLDINYLLMLFSTQNIKNEVLADISEKDELKQELIIQYMDNRNYPKIIEYCNKYGKEDVNIWIQALTYFINYYSSDKTTVGYINTILKQLLSNEGISPLVIMEMIKKLNYCDFSLTKETINEYIAKLHKSQLEDKKQMNDNYKKIEKLNGDIKDLSRKSKLFNMNKCSFCNQQLFMPITYFFCGHAFHPYCLNIEVSDNLSDKCPTCFKSNYFFINNY